MKAEGSCRNATPCDRGIPVPLAPVTRDGSDIASRTARMRAASPIILANPEEFTAEQLRRAGFTPGKRRAQVTAAMRRTRAGTVAAMYLDGLTAPQIAARVGVSKKTVLADLEAAGIPRSKGRRAKKETT